MNVASVAPRLPIVLRPGLGENARGFLRRLAEANGHRGIGVFSQAVGLSADLGPMSSDRIWSRLAIAACLTETEVGALRWGMADPARPGTTVVVAGTRTVLVFARPKCIRLCPACLRETGIWRDFWSFSCIVACPRHGTLLVTNCNCGRPLLAHDYGPIWTCTCGIVAGDLDTVVAPKSALEVARNLAARVGVASGYVCENDLSAPLDALCAHDYMVLIHTLGLAATAAAHEDAPMLQEQRLYRTGISWVVPPLDVVLARLQAAATIIRGWPDAYMSLLGEVEGRNVSTDPSKVSGAFATAIGKLLGRPMRGADGLPLRILNQAFDQYWSEHHNGRFRRRPRILANDATAKRIHALFNATILARAVGAPKGTVLMRRVVHRIFECLDDRDRDHEDGDLAHLALERGIAIYRALATSISSKAARGLVEGTAGSRALSGWEHPRLIPADPALHGLRLPGKSAYAIGVVWAILARLRVVARRVERSDGLLPLMTAGLRGNMTPYYTKTIILLDVVDGRLAVYTTVDTPRFCDLFVNGEDIRRARSARSPVNQLADTGGIGTREQVNVVLHGHFGTVGRLTGGEFLRLARGKLVRCRTEDKARASRKSPRWARRYNVSDVVDFVRRRLSVGGLSAAEAQAYGRVDDIGPVLITLKGADLVTSDIAMELATRGVKDERGAVWTPRLIVRAITRLEKGGRVLGLLTGPAFTHGAAPLGPTLPGARHAEMDDHSRASGSLLSFSLPVRPQAAPTVQPSHTTEHDGHDSAVIAFGDAGH